jgi:hypothetical protein
VAYYHAYNRHERTESKRFRSFGYEELEKRDKLSLYLFWLRDETTRARALCEETRLQSSGRGRRNRAA